MDHAALTHALRIPGAASISVISVERRTAIWTVAADRHADEPDFAERVADVAGAADRLARDADAGSPVGDVLLIDPSRFHLLRVVDDGECGHLAIHLVLDRRMANLALARREFASVVDAHAAVPATVSATVPNSVPAAVPAAVSATVPAAVPATVPAAVPASTDDVADPTAPPLPGRSWFDFFAEEPFADDDNTLERVLTGLRRLER